MKPLIPLEISELFKKLIKRCIYFKGKFQNWEQARLHSTGYDSELILEKVKAAQLQVRGGNASFERDSILFDRIHHSFPVLVALQHAALINSGRLSVLDFGGALGSSYFQCRPFLGRLEKLQWSIVEQPNFVQCGKQFFTDNILHFFDTIPDCIVEKRPNIALLSSSLQYIPEPYKSLGELIKCRLDVIVIDRTPFSNIDYDFLTVQHVPKKIYPASYPCWIFSRSRFQDYVHAHYNILAEFASADGTGRAAGTLFNFGGMILCKRD